LSDFHPAAASPERQNPTPPATIGRGLSRARALIPGLARAGWRITANAAFTASNWIRLRLYVTLRSRAVAMADTGPPPKTNLSVALTAHVFYPELIDEVLTCWRKMPDGTPLFVTTTRERAGVVLARLGDLPGLTVLTDENRGRDVAPFLALMWSGRLDAYDVVLKLHTKRSPHLRYGDLVRRALYLALAGSRDDIGRILAIFADPKVGMVGWAPVFLTTGRHWRTNRQRVEALVDRMGMPMPEAPGFFGGTMFWFRPAAMTPLARLPLGRQHFEPESGQLDGTLHHALERCFSLAASGAGFSVRDTAGRELAAPAPRG
jgi:lipopolysaccharide biosynthesis protein